MSSHFRKSTRRRTHRAKSARFDLGVLLDDPYYGQNRNLRGRASRRLRQQSSAMGSGHCHDHTPAVPQEPAQDRLSAALNRNGLRRTRDAFQLGRPETMLRMKNDPMRWDGNMAARYVRQIRRLKAMQSFHHFCLSRADLVSSAAILLAVIAALSLSNHGREKTANLLFETVLVSCVLWPLCFFLNLLVVRTWRCPRCNSQPVGWVEKERKCFDCGLDFEQPE